MTIVTYERARELSEVIQRYRRAIGRAEKMLEEDYMRTHAWGSLSIGNLTIDVNLDVAKRALEEMVESWNTKLNETLDEFNKL